MAHIILMPASTYKHPVRSFVRRQGRLTASQQKALTLQWPKYGIEPNNQPLSFPEIYANHRPVILEIGFGNGELLTSMAQQHPDRNFLGIEVHRPGVGHLLLKLQEHSIKNVRIISQDAIEVLSDSIPEHSLEAIWLFFPDPWPKIKHHKRRIVNQLFLDLTARALINPGFLHLATDWQNYAAHMQTTVSKDPRYVLEKPPSKDHLLAHRPCTKFEHRGQQKGYAITDLIYRVTAS